MRVALVPPDTPPKLSITILVCTAVLSTRAVTCTTPMRRASKTVRATPPRVVTWDGETEAYCAHCGSTSKVTGTPSTGCPRASCTRTLTSAVGGNRSASTTLLTPSQITAAEVCMEMKYPEG